MPCMLTAERGIFRWLGVDIYQAIKRRGKYPLSNVCISLEDENTKAMWF